MKKKRKKNYKKASSRKQVKQSSVSYICNNCGEKEEIPEDVLEYFDEINPASLLSGSHQFSCEKCGVGIMRPEEEPEVIVRGYGLFEGFELGDF